MDRLEAAAAIILKDPRSAQWERLQRATRPNVRGEPTDVVCGIVNAKGGFGGYTGRKPFVFFVGAGTLHISGGGSDVGNMVSYEMVKTFCTGMD